MFADGSAVPSAQRLPVRSFGFTTLRDLRCPRGHHIREDAFVFDHLALRCKHKEPNRRVGRSPYDAGADRRRAPADERPAGHGPECGALVYVLACSAWTDLSKLMREGNESRPTLLFTAEVTHAELEEMRRQKLDVSGVLDFLGVRFPTPEWSSLPGGARRRC